MNIIRTHCTSFETLKELIKIMFVERKKLKRAKENRLLSKFVKILNFYELPKMKRASLQLG